MNKNEIFKVPGPQLTTVTTDNEPSLYDMIYYYYESNGFCEKDAKQLTDYYINEWLVQYDGIDWQTLQEEYKDLEKM